MVDEKPLQSKMVAAYLIGMPVYKNDFKQCKPCQNATETKCFVSWRTYLEGEEGEAYLKLEPAKAVEVTNPISWLSNYEPAKIVKQKAIVKKFTKALSYNATVVAHNNILWLSKPSFTGSFLLSKNKLKNLHKGDINLFYQSIRQNVVDRINAYFGK
jgi:hypothetical protein